MTESSSPATRESSTPSAPPADGVSAKEAGRGGLALAAGKLVFLVSGLAQQILLSRILGIGGYGALSTAQSVASISYNPIVQAGIQGVSREVASVDAAERPFVQRRLLNFHVVLAVVCSAVFFALATPLARFLGAPHVASGIRILSLILFLYGLYAPLVGVLNGHRRFMGQAVMDMLAAGLRTVGLAAGAYVVTVHLTPQGSTADPGFQVVGTAWGFVAAAVIIFGLAYKLTGWGKAGGRTPPYDAYAIYVLPILGGQVLLNYLFQADALLLRRFAAEAAAMASLAPEAADPYVGAYRQTQLFCFLPFQLLTSITFVLFPLLASARAQGRSEDVSRLIHRGLRIALIVAGMLVSPIVAIPEGLLTLVFGPEAALGAPAMRILAIGMGFFAVLGVMTTAMNSLGAERQSFILVGLAALLVTGLCVFGVRTDELSGTLLVRVASATSAAMLVATLVASVLLLRVSGATIPLLPLVRVGVAVCAAAFLGARFFQGSIIHTLIGAPVIALLFIVVLIATRELGNDDLNQLRALVVR